MPSLICARCIRADARVAGRRGDERRGEAGGRDSSDHLLEAEWFHDAWKAICKKAIIAEQICVVVVALIAEALVLLLSESSLCST
jgi:hypothetical protein